MYTNIKRIDGQQTEVIQINDNKHLHSIGQGEDRQRK
jgi:hypothetical protein